MTDQPNWREMEAGAELDRLVAEKVGYELTWTTNSFESEQRICDGLPPFPKTFWRVYDVDWEAWYYVGLPAYSTDVNKALELVEGQFQFETGRNETDQVVWQAQVGLAQWQTAYSPALAIVRAWLAWREKQETI